MKRGVQGTYRQMTAGGESYRIYLPRALPPQPPLKLDTTLQDRLERANRALGRLDGIAAILPDRALFLYMYVRKEAVLSSQIEGTQSSLSDLLLHESGQAAGAPLDDILEVSRYVKAQDYGLRKLREGAPLTLRLLREIHGVLLSGGRGSEKSPGEFRRSPVWIGGTRPGNALFVPPAPENVMECMGDLEMFLHDRPVRTPTLLKAALCHVQFETIHPFLDGNGRLGRLLITFLLCAESALSEPLLYLSLYLKTHRETYYDLLQRVRLEGEWEAWLDFFLEGVISTGESACETVRRILSLFEQDREKIQSMGRTAGSLLRVHQVLSNRAMSNVQQIAIESGLSWPTAAAALQKLCQAGIVREATGRTKDRLFVYDRYLSILNEGTETPFRE